MFCRFRNPRNRPLNREGPVALWIKKQCQYEPLQYITNWLICTWFTLQIDIIKKYETKIPLTIFVGFLFKYIFWYKQFLIRSYVKYIVTAGYQWPNTVFASNAVTIDVVGIQVRRGNINLIIFSIQPVVTLLWYVLCMKVKLASLTGKWNSLFRRGSAWNISHFTDIRDPMRWIFPICVILPATLGSGVYSASNRNEYQKEKMFLWLKVRPLRRAANPAAICEPIV
jgi:hypothetical protein